MTNVQKAGTGLELCGSKTERSERKETARAIKPTKTAKFLPSLRTDPSAEKYANPQMATKTATEVSTHVGSKLVSTLFNQTHSFGTPKGTLNLKAKTITVAQTKAIHVEIENRTPIFRSPFKGSAKIATDWSLIFAAKEFSPHLGEGPLTVVGDKPQRYLKLSATLKSMPQKFVGFFNLNQQSRCLGSWVRASFF